MGFSIYGIRLANTNETLVNITGYVRRVKNSLLGFLLNSFGLTFRRFLCSVLQSYGVRHYIHLTFGLDNTGAEPYGHLPENQRNRS
jgi:hypothetical protein